MTWAVPAFFFARPLCYADSKGVIVMAVVKSPQSGKVVLRVQTGVSEKGSPVFKLRTYANIRSEAADSDIYAVAAGLGSLQQYTLVDIVRQDINTLINQ